MGSWADDGAGRRARGSRSERASRRGPRKATQGSTTYDEAAEVPLDPAWDGGAWYGPSSGTYWTLNPREYADPRKHGPEYLARARRAARGSGAADGGSTRDTGARNTPEAAGRAPGEAEPAPGPAPRSGVESEGGRWRWGGDGRTTTDGGNAELGTRAWTCDSRAFPGTEWTDGPTGRRDPRPAGRSAGLLVEDASPLLDLETIARRAAPRSLLALARRPGWRWRLLLALVGWPPIGFAAGTLIPTVTGCGTFSAGCPDPMPLLPTAAQPLVVLALFLGAPAAAAAAFASLLALVVALPVAAVLSVGSLPDSRVAAPVLGGLTAGGYLVALVAGVVGVRRAGPGEAARDPGDAARGPGEAARAP